YALPFPHRRTDRRVFIRWASMIARKLRSKPLSPPKHAETEAREQGTWFDKYSGRAATPRSRLFAPGRGRSSELSKNNRNTPPVPAIVRWRTLAARKFDGIYDGILGKYRHPISVKIPSCF